MIGALSLSSTKGSRSMWNQAESKKKKWFGVILLLLTSVINSASSRTVTSLCGLPTLKMWPLALAGFSCHKSRLHKEYSGVQSRAIRRARKLFAKGQENKMGPCFQHIIVSLQSFFARHQWHPWCRWKFSEIHPHPPVLEALPSSNSAMHGRKC